MIKRLLPLLMVASLLALSVPVVSASQDKLPSDAQQVVVKADAKIEVAKKAYDLTVAQIRSQEVKDLQRIYDATKKGDPERATAIKDKIDSLAAAINAIVAKGTTSPAESWIQGKWSVRNGEGNYRAVWEFRGKSVVQGDMKGTASIDGGEVQVTWNNSVIEVIKIPDPLADETTGQGRAGVLAVQRAK